MTTASTKKEAHAKNIRYLRDKDREMVRGIFRFHEVPGGSMSFPFRAYKGDPIENIGPLVDGQVYTLPLGVARHLNKNLWYPQHSHALDERGMPIFKVSQKVRRASFQSLEFVDVEDLTPEGASGLVTVEKTVSDLPRLD